jgi:hypothetical protein
MKSSREITARFKKDMDAGWRIKSSMRDYNPGWAQMQYFYFSGLLGNYNHDSQEKQENSTPVL